MAQTIPQFVDQLRAEGFVVKDGGTIPGDSKGLYVALQATEQNGGAADFIGFQTALRQAVIAKSHGLQIDAIKVETFNPSGTIISGQRIPLTDTRWAVDPKWSSQPGISDNDIERTVDQAVNTDAITSDKVQVATDSAGYRTLSIDAKAENNTHLAASLDDIRAGVTQAVKQLNGAKGALIALVVIDIDSPTGNALHRSWLDFQLQTEGYWNDPAVQSLLPAGRLSPVGAGL